MATKLGLPAIAFTDWTSPAPAGGLLDLDGYLACLDRCRAAHPDLRILTGAHSGRALEVNTARRTGRRP